MHHVVNRAAGPRIIHTKAGTVTLDPGKSHDGEFEEGNLAAMKRRRGDFEITEVAGPAQAGAEDTGEPDSFDPMSDDELRAFIEKRDGKAPHPNMKRENLLKKARNEE